MNLPVGDDDVGLASDDRLDQVGDALLGILVVAVGVHDDVRAELEGADHPVVERAAETLVADVVHELGDAVGARDLDGAVAAAVVDDEDDDLVDARDRLRDALEHRRKGLLLVQARDLDD